MKVWRHKGKHKSSVHVAVVGFCKVKTGIGSGWKKAVLYRELNMADPVKVTMGEDVFCVSDKQFQERFFMSGRMVPSDQVTEDQVVAATAENTEVESVTDESK